MSIKINPDIIVEDVDDGLVLINPLTGKIRVLNTTGSFIWTSLANGKTALEIQSHLVDSYQLSQEQAAADVETFILDLHNRGLLVQ